MFRGHSPLSGGSGVWREIHASAFESSRRTPAQRYLFLKNANTMDAHQPATVIALKKMFQPSRLRQWLSLASLAPLLSLDLTQS